MADAISWVVVLTNGLGGGVGSGKAGRGHQRYCLKFQQRYSLLLRTPIVDTRRISPTFNVQRHARHNLDDVCSMLWSVANVLRLE